MSVFISLFVFSCVQQFAQYYQLTIDEAELQRMRDSLPESIKSEISSPNTGKLRLLRARSIFKQFHPSRPVSPQRQPTEPENSEHIPFTPPIETKSNRIFWQGRKAVSKVVDKKVC